MRITLDTNVLVGGNDNASGIARRILLLILRQRHTLVASQSILYETEEVLHYPRIRTLYRLTHEQARRYIEFLTEVAEIVDIGPPVELPIADRDDWAVLRTAIQGSADVLCTIDAGFHKPPVLAFCSQYGLEVKTPVELLRYLEQHATN